jgi:hypothetical protein
MHSKNKVERDDDSKKSHHALIRLIKGVMEDRPPSPSGIKRYPPLAGHGQHNSEHDDQLRKDQFLRSGTLTALLPPA